MPPSAIATVAKLQSIHWYNQRDWGEFQNIRGNHTACHWRS